MSGYDEQEVIARHATEGLAGVLHKPFSAAELEATLARAMEKAG